MHEVVGKAADSLLGGEMLRGGLVEPEAMQPRHLLGDDDHKMLGQGGAGDEMRPGNVVGEAIARGHDNLPTVLLEDRRSLGLENHFDHRMLVASCPLGWKGDAMPGGFYLAEF